MADVWTARRVLITGGLGFIGSNLAIDLVSRGARVCIVDALRPAGGGSWSNIEPVRDDVEVHVFDLCDEERTRRLVHDRDVIFSLAGQVSHVASMEHPEADLADNCREQLVLLETCRRQNRDARLIYTSTRQVYGRCSQLPVTEDAPVIPVDVNGIHKRAVEQYLRLYAETYGLKTASLRLTNTYGPRMDVQDPRKGFVGVLLGRAFRGEPLLIFGSGQQVRDFNYVDDVVSALRLAADLDDLTGAVWNLGAEHPCTVLEFVQTLQQLIPVRYSHVPFPGDRQSIEIGDYYGDFSRFAAATGWRPEVSLHEGLRRTCEFFAASARVGSPRACEGVT